MKSFIGKSLLAITFIVASSHFGLSQTRSKEHDLSPFTGIEASDGFKVSVNMGERFSAKLTMDDALESYVMCYVKSGVLHLGLDGKGLPKDMKKMYKGKNSPEPTLVAVVTMPSLKSLTLNDDSQFFSSGKLEAEDIIINMSGSSMASNFAISGKTLGLSLSKNAKFTNVSADFVEDINVSADGKAAVAIEGQAKNLQIIASGNSAVDVKAEVENAIKVEVSSGSQTSVSGKASSLELSGKGTSAKVDASALKTGKVSVALTGVSADVSPLESLDLDLGRGAEVSFSGDPVINLIKIQNASVIRK
ncbi:MAG: DUF2807 domain-containing protein [Bacteroidales bacterium]|nr:DUF2807 domain-containing protein [Bacteroidales bacterium]